MELMQLPLAASLTQLPLQAGFKTPPAVSSLGTGNLVKKRKTNRSEKDAAVLKSWKPVNTALNLYDFTACHEAREFRIDCFWMSLNRCCDFRCCFLAIGEKGKNLLPESDTRAFPHPAFFATLGLPALGSIRESPLPLFYWTQPSSCRVRSQNVRVSLSPQRVYLTHRRHRNLPSQRGVFRGCR